MTPTLYSREDLVESAVCVLGTTCDNVFIILELLLF